MFRYILCTIIFLLFSSSSYAYTNTQYLERAEKLGIIAKQQEDKLLSRSEATILLTRAVNLDKYSKKFEYKPFYDVSDKDWYFESIRTAVEYGIILSDDYPNNYLNPEGSITNHEFLKMLGQIHNSHKSLENLTWNSSIFSKQFGIEDSLKKVTKTNAIISTMKLIDSIYFDKKYCIDLLNPISGNYYQKNINIVVDSNASKYISRSELYINGNAVKTLDKFEKNIKMDISKYKSGLYEMKILGYTNDGLVLESLPVSVFFNKEYSSNPFTSQPDTDIIEKTISPSNFQALSNKIKQEPASKKRLLFLSNSPEELKNATGNLLFDSGIQSDDFRLLLYHVNDLTVQSSVYLKVEIENLGNEDICFSEHGGYSSSAYGNAAGYYSTLNYFTSFDNTNSSQSIRVREYSIPAYSKKTILMYNLNYNNIASYLGDFDFKTKGFYRLKVMYFDTKSDEILSKLDGKHIRGIFPVSDYSINVDKSNVCFQIGNDRKKYASESNINSQSYGVSDQGFTINDGHFGEVFDINISNKDLKNLLVAVEFRGTTKGYPSFFMYRDGSGRTKSYGIKDKYALYLGKQLIIERTNAEAFDFQLTIPSGMNGPLYVYVMEDV